MTHKLLSYPIGRAVLAVVLSLCACSGWAQQAEGFDCVGAKSIFIDWAFAIQTGPKEAVRVPRFEGHIMSGAYAPDELSQAIRDAVDGSIQYFQEDAGRRTLQQFNDYVNDPDSTPFSLIVIATLSIDDLDGQQMALRRIIGANRPEVTTFREELITDQARLVVGYDNDIIQLILLIFEADQIDFLPFMASQLLRMSFVADEKTVFELQDFFNQYILISNEYCPEWLTNPVTIPFSINRFEGVD